MVLNLDAVRLVGAISLRNRRSGMCKPKIDINHMLYLSPLEQAKLDLKNYIKRRQEELEKEYND